MNHRHCTAVSFPILLLVILLSGGCMTPWNTKFPDWMPGSLEYERREAQVQDPFPDSDLGPGTSMRPPAFDQQRSEATRVKERGTAAAIRRQFGMSGVPPAPELGVVYPEAVRP